MWSRPPTISRVELLYLPYYFFDVQLMSDAGTRQVGIAVDAVLAATVFFTSDALVREPAGEGTRCEFFQSPEAARRTALDEYRGFLLEHGLRSKRAVTVGAISEPERVLYPLWVAYLKRRGAYDVRALDAVSGEGQGVKARKVLLAALRRMAPPG